MLPSSQEGEVALGLASDAATGLLPACLDGRLRLCSRLTSVELDNSSVHGCGG